MTYKSLFGQALAQGTQASSSPKMAWKPNRTWVIAIGVLAYPDGDAWPQAGRRDQVMVEQLQKVGVPFNQILFIKDKEATHKHIDKKFPEFLSQSSPGDTIWFYFAGHGSQTEDGVGTFVLYDKEWHIPDIFSNIERHFKGSQGLLFADCCYSGNLALEAMVRAGRIAYGVLTSSMSSVVSTGAWTFTDCLIQGLTGGVKVDSNSDGHLDFLELAAYTEKEMAAQEGQLTTFVAANGFDPRLVLVSSTKREHPKIGHYVSGLSKDQHWYVGRIDGVKENQYLIKWVGYDESHREWVAIKNTKDMVFDHYPPGTKVSVEWKKKWYPAAVLTGRLGMHLIHFDGFSSIWDEWVHAKRIKSV